MKRNRPITSRQNDSAAIKLLKASYRCYRNERIAKYAMLFLSFGICIAAILNKYLPQIAPSVANIHGIQESAATYINLISGVILVVGIAVGFYTSRMHTEGTALRDRYEAYVFDNPPNLSMLRPIAQTVIDMYSHKTRKKDGAFRDFLYAQNDDPEGSTAQFEYINREVHSDYRLYISVQPFFITLWIGFCLLIVILAVSINDKFVTTLINIMIPSLSAISTIGNSWHSYRQQLRQLQNLLTVIDQIQRLPDDKRVAYITDKRNMRALADGLYNYRSSAFVIPNFLVRRHLKSSVAQTVTIPYPSEEKYRPRTEMPSLTLPELEDAVPEINEIISGVTARTVTFSPEHRASSFNVNTKKRYSARDTSVSASAKQATKRASEPKAQPAQPKAQPARPAQKQSADKPKK